MNEIREQSLLLSVNDFIKKIKQTLLDQKFIEQIAIEEILIQIINRDREYIINVLQSDINDLQTEINKINKRKNKYAHNYAIKVNELSLENQKIRRKINEKSIMDSKLNIKERKKQFKNLYDQFFYWLSQFQQTILEIKEKKSLIKHEIQSLHAEIAALSSNNLVVLRHANQRIKLACEKTKAVMNYQIESFFVKQSEKYKKKISKYKSKNAEYENGFKDMVDILGKYSLDPKSLILDLKRKTYEKQLSENIDDDCVDVKSLAERLRARCDLAFENKDSELDALLKEREIKENQLKQKLYLATLNCGIQNNQKEASKLYSPRFSPKRDTIDILINHKSLKYASYEESSKLLNRTFDEINRLRQSRIENNAIFSSSNSFE